MVDSGRLGEAEMAMPIQLLSQDCEKLFQDSALRHVIHSGEMTSLIEECHEAFTSWTSFLSVFAATDSCLDYRLRKHSAVQDIIIRLLEILRRNVYLLSTAPGNLERSAHVQEPQSHDALETMPSEIRAVLTGIQDSITRLNKLAITISQSSRSAAITLARNFATANRDLDEFEDIVTIALETLYPNAADSLRRQLCDTMTDRYARLEYDAHRKGKSQSRSFRALGATGQIAVQDGEYQNQKSAELPTKVISAPQSSQKDMLFAGETSHQKPLSTIDTALLRHNFGSVNVHTAHSRPTLSVYQADNRLHEPVPPRFGDGENTTTCEWCQEIIDRSLVNDKRWSEAGRNHYRNDLKPFPCLSEECIQSRPSFPSRGGWLKHMMSHSNTWSHKIHRQPKWVCNEHTESGGGTTYAFSTESEFHRHRMLLHSQRDFASAEEITQSLTKQPVSDETRSLELCPLCLFGDKGTAEAGRKKATEHNDTASAPSRSKAGGMQSEKGDRTASQKQRGRVTFADDVSSQSGDLFASHPEPNHSQVDDEMTPFELGLHVAAHLQYLMVLSLRLMKTVDYNDDDYDADGISESAAPTVGSSASSLNTEDSSFSNEEWKVLPLSFTESDPLILAREPATELTLTAVSEIPSIEITDTLSDWWGAIDDSPPDEPTLEEKKSEHITHYEPQGVEGPASKTLTYGIKALYQPEDGSFDMVFIHGLNGDRDTTWTAQDATEPWPKTLLPPIFPTVRILTFGYDALVTSWQEVVSFKRISGNAFDLLLALSSYRENDGTNERPIIFICHSMGGLVCEDALITSYQRAEPHLQKILQSTHGLVFLGTPHNGAGLAHFVETFPLAIGLPKQKNRRSFNIFRRKISQRNVSERDSEVLARIQGAFRKIVKTRTEEAFQPINILCFYEEVPLTAVGLVVRMESAVLPEYPCVGIHGNHIDMVRFKGPDDPGFIALCEELKRWIGAAEKPKSNFGQSRIPGGNATGPLTEAGIQNCLRDLRLTDPYEDKEAMKRRNGDRASGTCEWILNTEELAGWLGSGTDDILWFYGSPGIGKSTIAIFLCEELAATFARRNDRSVAYFLCDFRDRHRKTATAVIRGLLFQLIQQHSQLLSYLLPEYRHHGEELFNSFETLWHIFLAAAMDSNTGQKYYIIDALDECDQQSQDMLLRHFHEVLSSSTKPAIRILVLSRFDPDIGRHLVKFASKDLASYSQTERDVKLYIEERVSILCTGKEYTETVRSQVRKLLLEEAGGTFLWASLACNMLDRTPAHYAIDALGRIPEGLELLYNELLHADLRRDMVVGEILRFVAVSLEPLDVLEISEACEIHLDEDKISERERFTRERIYSCRLMVIGQDQRVRLLHPTVRDYLVMGGYFDLMHTHAELASRCVSLLIEEFHCGQPKSPAPHFLPYAVMNWPNHVRVARSKFLIQESQLEFFDVISPCREQWLKRLRSEVVCNPPIPLNFSILHIAAWFGLSTLVHHVYEKAGQTAFLEICESIDSTGATPLEQAAQSDYTDVFSAILDLGGELTTSAVQAAAGNPSYGKEMMSLSLYRGGNQLLIAEKVVQSAASNEDDGVIALLLNIREDRIPITEKVLESAGRNKNHKVMALLLDRLGDHAPITDNVLRAAERNENDEVMSLLLERRFLSLPVPSYS